MKLVQEFVHHSHILCSGSLLLAQSCDVDCAPQQNSTKGAQLLQHKLHTSGTPCGTAGGAALVGSFKMWPNPVAMARSVPGEPSSVSTCGRAKGKVASNQAQMALPPQGQQERDPGCAKSKFSSVRNPQTEEFPMPIPKQKPFEMLTASPDIALLCVLQLLILFKAPAAGEAALVMSWLVFIVSAEAVITEGGQGMFFPISGAFEWV